MSSNLSGIYDLMEKNGEIAGLLIGGRDGWQEANTDYFYSCGDDVDRHSDPMFGIDSENAGFNVHTRYLEDGKILGLLDDDMEMLTDAGFVLDDNHPILYAKIPLGDPELINKVNKYAALIEKVCHNGG